MSTDCQLYPSSDRLPFGLNNRPSDGKEFTKFLKKGGNELLLHFHLTIAPHIKDILSKIWIPPHESAKIISSMIEETHILSEYKIMVSGETDNISLYLTGKDNIWVYSPFTQFEDNIIIRETSCNILAARGEHLCIVEKNEILTNRLKIPKVVLINPSVKEIFPTPRLALCVSSLAAYLRKYQKADVRILDMQIGLTEDEIINRIKNICPDIIGISISFGQMPLGERILERIFSEIVAERETIVIAGNVISAFGYERFLEKFPNLLICYSEGEKTMVDLVDYINGNKNCILDEVSGITYIENGKIRKSSIVEVDMDDLPLPAMDTLEGLIKNKGALTMEISRNCYHRACSFCPRTHKPGKWKGMSPQLVLKQLKHYKMIFDHFDIENRIFMADEEFVGCMGDGKEAERITKIANEVIEKGLNLSFDQNTRIDQIYNPNKDKKWHVERMNMLLSCKNAGLDRLLVGIESGSDTVLKRFNKNITANQSVTALRILSALEVGIRITFITFDHLMNFKELKENVLFLERDDVFLQPVNLSKIACDELFGSIHDDQYIRKNSLRQPLYENVAYMLVNLEVLMNSHYIALLANAEIKYNKKLFITNTPDYNMARYKVCYLDESIGAIANGCQKWIDRHFALDYCLKGMYKVTNKKEREYVFKFRARYRKFSFLLLKSLVWIFDPHNTISLEKNLSDIEDIIINLERIKQKKLGSTNDQIIIEILDLYNEKMKLLILEIESLLNTDEIQDENFQLREAINQWRVKKEWNLINP